jgi:hypothetical protein
MPGGFGLSGSDAHPLAEAFRHGYRSGLISKLMPNCDERHWRRNKR